MMDGSLYKISLLAQHKRNTLPATESSPWIFKPASWRNKRMEERLIFLKVVQWVLLSLWNKIDAFLCLLTALTTHPVYASPDLSPSAASLYMKYQHFHANIPYQNCICTSIQGDCFKGMDIYWKSLCPMLLELLINYKQITNSSESLKPYNKSCR